MVPTHFKWILQAQGTGLIHFGYNSNSLSPRIGIPVKTCLRKFYTFPYKLIRSLSVSLCPRFRINNNPVLFFFSEIIFITWFCVECVACASAIIFQFLIFSCAMVEDMKYKRRPAPVKFIVQILLVVCDPPEAVSHSFISTYQARIVRMLFQSQSINAHGHIYLCAHIYLQAAAIRTSPTRFDA